MKSAKLAIGALVLVLVAPALKYALHASPVLVFLSGAAGIVVLADWIRRATEQASTVLGSAIGGLMNVSFGSAAEIILAFFVLRAGHPEVVKAQITGSILGTSLFGLGLAIVAGTIGRDRLRFGRERARSLASLFILVVIALLLPAVFDLAEGRLAGQALAIDEQRLSLGVAVVLLLLYAGNLVYTLVTHRDAFTADEAREPAGPRWPLPLAVGVLVAATVGVAFEAELVSGALEATASSLGLSQVFMGVVVLALLGTVSDLVSAAVFARQGKMGLVLQICVGSAVQVALVVAPLLVVASWLLGKPMTLVFGNPLDLFAIAGAAFIVNSVANDGEATWFEGMLLIGVYVLFGLGFYFVAA